MAVSKQKFREIVLQLLFSDGFEGASDAEMLPFMMKQLAVSKSGIRKAQQKKQEIMEKLEEIDRCLANAMTSYRLERVPHLEHAVLRLGAYELLYTNLPYKISIAEALRLARKYATEEAVSFVNAILDKIHKTCTSKAIVC